MQAFTIETENGYKRTIGKWQLDEHNIYYVPRSEHVMHIQDISTQCEQKFHLTLESGAERFITQYDLDNNRLQYCKYNEFVKRITLRDAE